MRKSLFFSLLLCATAQLAAQDLAVESRACMASYQELLDNVFDAAPEVYRCSPVEVAPVQGEESLAIFADGHFMGSLSYDNVPVAATVQRCTSAAWVDTDVYFLAVAEFAPRRTLVADHGLTISEEEVANEYACALYVSLQAWLPVGDTMHEFSRVPQFFQWRPTDSGYQSWLYFAAELPSPQPFDTSYLADRAFYLITEDQVVLDTVRRGELEPEVPEAPEASEVPEVPEAPAEAPAEASAEAPEVPERRLGFRGIPAAEAD